MSKARTLTIDGEQEVTVSMTADDAFLVLELMSQVTQFQARLIKQDDIEGEELRDLLELNYAISRFVDSASANNDVGLMLVSYENDSVH
jgi:Mg2+ and Co2+ transporter CorA